MVLYYYVKEIKKFNWREAMRIIGCLCIVFLFAVSSGCSEDETVYPSQKDSTSAPLPDKGVTEDQSQAEDTGEIDQEAPPADQAIVDQEVTSDQEVAAD